MPSDECGYATAFKVELDVDCQLATCMVAD